MKLNKIILLSFIFHTYTYTIYIYNILELLKQIMDQLVFFYKIAALKESQDYILNLLKKDIQYTYFKILDEYFIFAFAEKKYNLKEFDTALYKVCGGAIEILNRRKRRLRSLNGFFMYVLEFINDKNCTILNTNLSPLFWLEVEPVLRQNRKDVLKKFLFEEKIENLAY